MSLFGFGPRMLKNVYKGVMILSLDAVVYFTLVAGVEHIVTRTRYSPVLAHSASLWSFEVDWGKLDCPRWYRYDYGTASVREVPLTLRGGLQYRESYPQAGKGVSVMSLIEIQPILKKTKDCSERILY